MIRAALVLLLISTSVFAQEYGQDVRVLESPIPGSEPNGKIALELVNKILVETPGPINQIINEYRTYLEELGLGQCNSKKCISEFCLGCGMLETPSELVVLESGKNGMSFISCLYRVFITWLDDGSGLFTHPIMALDISQVASTEEGGNTTTLTTKVVGFKNFLGGNGSSDYRLPKPPWQKDG